MGGPVYGVVGEHGGGVVEQGRAQHQLLLGVECGVHAVKIFLSGGHVSLTDPGEPRSPVSFELVNGSVN